MDYFLSIGSVDVDGNFGSNVVVWKINEEASVKYTEAITEAFGDPIPALLSPRVLDILQDDPDTIIVTE